MPVERDGSAHFHVPADTAVYFQLLDENRMELRRMRRFISFQPGETRACAGCHETRGGRAAPAAARWPPRRAPSAPMPPPWGDRPVSFLRDIQPILDRHCVECHSGLKPAGGLGFLRRPDGRATTAPTRRSWPTSWSPARTSATTPGSRRRWPSARIKSKLAEQFRKRRVQQAAPKLTRRSGCGW